MLFLMPYLLRSIRVLSRVDCTSVDVLSEHLLVNGRLFLDGIIVSMDLEDLD